MAAGAATVVAARRLRAVGLAAGLDLVGVAPAQPFDDTRRVLEERRAAGLAAGMQFTYRNPARSCDPARTLPGARSLVVGALRYQRADRPATPSHPRPGAAPPVARVARYAREDFYRALRSALGRVADELRSGGHRAVVLADDNALVDRAAAVRAGLGWYGKNTTVLAPGRGSWYVLGAVLTDADLDPGAGAADRRPSDGCGRCARCLPACPTGALVAPGVLDARRCLAWLLQAPGHLPRELRGAVGDRLYGCDDCQEVCPVNRRADRADPPPAPGPGATAAVDVVELLGAGDEELLERFGRWYLPGRQPRVLRRNALVVLGNVGDPADARVVEAVAQALDHADPSLRAHAVWAAGRLGLADLVAARSLADDPDPDVRAEAEATL
ncbi:MAG: tRNA epoxyqueuosine(34) reductase QueG, partial [Acidimicrobiales bacterium]